MNRMGCNEKCNEWLGLAWHENCDISPFQQKFGT